MTSVCDNMGRQSQQSMKDVCSTLAASAQIKLILILINFSKKLAYCTK